MDLLGTMIKTEEDSISSVKNKFSPDDQEEEWYFKCHICDDLFPKKDLVLHKMAHIQGDQIKKNPGSVSENASSTDIKPFYKCPVCGKIYTERKKFVGHKRNHKRNKKLKELGIHPSNKEGCLKLKACVASKISSANQTMGSLATSKIKSVNGSIDNSKIKSELLVKEKSELPMKLMINPDITADPNNVNGSIDSSQIKLELPIKLMINPDVTANPMNVNGSFDNSQIKLESPMMNSELPMKLMINPDVTANPMSVNGSDGNTKAKSEWPTKMMINSHVIDNSHSINVGYCDSSKLKSELPMKLMINPDVTANPINCVADWAPPEPVKSQDISPFIISPVNLVTQDSSQTERNPPAKKTSFKCSICGRTFIFKKMFQNHRTNHFQNKKKQKLLFYDRPCKKESLKLSKQKK